jgi:carbon-monoxide dehydrogenase small subunit
VKHDISLIVNGTERRGSTEARTSLADFLREELDLTGTHVGCEQGVCGACTVLVQGELVRSCLIFAVQANGKRVETIEGLSVDGELGTIPAAFREAISFQCGFCSPGFLMTVTGLLRENPMPTTEEICVAISGNLCRCTGYESILEGVRRAAENLHASALVRQEEMTGE